MEALFKSTGVRVHVAPKRNKLGPDVGYIFESYDHEFIHIYFG